MDRLSAHRFVANYFRLYLHAAALHLLVRWRRFLAAPRPAEVPEPTTEAARPLSGLPAAAQAEAARRRRWRQRRQRDPLGEGQPCTGRSLLIKVAAEVVASTRRVVVRRASSGPHRDWYRPVGERRCPPVLAVVPQVPG